ncbi:hypothetical protein N5J29_09125 [Stenotrophomonas sp. GD03680]|uniref:hypothetical protein n=1 Tax=Stenotrophomonas sp. GD03680 TaxID=2975365 RepID=UPI00244AA490|nr:hypothetical protein [Stenotrophomonas sp. GD03680]MDH2022917.1 hypothetical protein [Stenotrophomonas sp. GD03680]
MANHSVPPSPAADASRLANGEHYLSSMWRGNPLSDCLTNRLVRIDQNTKAAIAILDVIRRDFTSKQDLRDTCEEDERVLYVPLTEHVVDCLMLGLESLLSESEDLLTYVRDNERDVCRQPLKEAARV